MSELLKNQNLQTRFKELIMGVGDDDFAHVPTSLLVIGLNSVLLIEKV